MTRISSTETRYSELPYQDIWQRLLHYGYSANVRKQLGDRASDDLVECITSHITQSYEYFEAYKSVSLNTSPVLLYYGAVNLLYAAVLMDSKKMISIKSHGAATIPAPREEIVGNTVIRLSGSESGAYRVFANTFQPDESNLFPEWQLKDVLRFLPELRPDFESCYDGEMHCCIPVETVIRKTDTFDRIRKEEIGTTQFSSIYVKDYERAYLPMQDTGKYYILRRRLNFDEIGVQSLSGQRYIVSHLSRSGKWAVIGEIISYFLALYALSVLSRYHSPVWQTFVRSDTTGERGLMLAFLTVARRKLPNLILSEITGKNVIFTAEKRGTLDFTKDYDPEDVKRIVVEELQRSKYDVD